MVEDWKANTSSFTVTSGHFPAPSQHSPRGKIIVCRKKRPTVLDQGQGKISAALGGAKPGTVSYSLEIIAASVDTSSTPPQLRPSCENGAIIHPFTGYPPEDGAARIGEIGLIDMGRDLRLQRHGCRSSSISAVGKRWEPVAYHD